MRYKLLLTGSMVLLSAFTGIFQDRCSAGDITESVVSERAEKLVTSRDADGLSIGFIQDVRYGTYHFGRNAGGVRPDNLTIYEIGSASKVFTSLLVADAATQGLIGLSAPAGVDNKAGIVLPTREDREITWLDLCTHRSGLPRLPGNMLAISLRNPYQSYDASKAAQFLNQFELTRNPGDRHEYSSFAMSVLGYLICEHLESDYQTLLRERVAKPLRMDDCTVDLNASQRARLAMPHRPAGNEVPLWEFANLPGAGGIRATLRDMMRFARAQLYPPDGTLGAAIELAWKQHHPGDETGPAMGLGWMILPDGQTHWHNGETGGSHSIMLINKEHRTAVIVLSNTAPGPKVDQLGMELMRYATSAEDSRAAQRQQTGIDSKRLEGRYQLAPNFVFDVRLVDGRMMVGITNQPTQEVDRESDTVWSYRSVDATLEFHLTDRAPAYALTLHQNGISQRAKRIRP